jgi:hypothetical protein
MRNGAMPSQAGYVPAAEFAGVDLDDPVAPWPAASIGDAAISSAGQRRSTTPPARAGRAARSPLLPPLCLARA